MTKKAYCISYCLAALAFVVGSCSKSDNPVTPAAKRYVVSQIETFDQDGNLDEIISFKYDDRGRIILKEASHQQEGSVSISNRYTYTYSDRLIIQSGQNSVNEFQLDDSGRIISRRHYLIGSEDKAELSYVTYDSDGHIASWSNTDESYKFEWNQGDLIRYTSADDSNATENVTIVPSDIEANGYDLRPVFNLIDEQLYQQGSFGRQNLHLPANYTKMSTGTNGSTINIEVQFVYEFICGRLKSFIMKNNMEYAIAGKSINSHSQTTCKLTWQEI